MTVYAHYLCHALLPGSLIERNWTKNQSNSIEPNCSTVSVTEHNRTGTFRWVRLPNSIEPIKLENRCWAPLLPLHENSCLKLKPIHNLFGRNALFETRWNWFYVRFLQCSIDCCVRFPNVRLCSIGKTFGWVRLSSITEPNRSQSSDWNSIGFDYRTFD